MSEPVRAVTGGVELHRGHTTQMAGERLQQHGRIVLPAPQLGRFYGGTRGRGVLSREEEAQSGPPAPQGFQSTLQMRSSWARHDFSMLLLSRSHRRSSPPKHPVSRRVPLTRQQEMGRSLPNWELSTNRFYFVRLLSRTNAILIPQLPDRLLVLREVGQIGLLLLLFLQSLSASSPYCMKEESPLNGVLEDRPSRGDECFTRSFIYGFLLHFRFVSTLILQPKNLPLGGDILVRHGFVI